MTLFDYAVLGIVGISVLVGVWRGVVSELLALAAWVVAFFAAREYASSVVPWLANWIAVCRYFCRGFVDICHTSICYFVDAYRSRFGIVGSTFGGVFWCATRRSDCANRGHVGRDYAVTSATLLARCSVGATNRNSSVCG